MPDLRVSLAGVELKNPIVVASGTYGFGHEYGEFYDLSELGAICVKGLTPVRRDGNPPPRIAETPAGILNSVGLQNPGVDAFIAEEMPFLRQYDASFPCKKQVNANNLLNIFIFVTEREKWQKTRRCASGGSSRCDKIERSKRMKRGNIK